MERCERYTQLLSARMDGELAPQERQELENHLAICPECRALAEQLEALRACMQDMEDVPAPQDFARGVMDRIRGQEQKPKVIPLFRRPQIRALAGLCAAVHWPIPDWNVQRRGRRTAHCGCRCQHAGSGPIPGGILFGRGVRTRHCGLWYGRQPFRAVCRSGSVRCWPGRRRGRKHPGHRGLRPGGRNRSTLPHSGKGNCHLQRGNREQRR